MRGVRSDLAAIAAARSFLFDLDGTLVDSTRAHDRAFRATLARVSEEKARTFVYARHKGKKTPETFRDLGFEDGRMVETLSERKRRAYRDFVAKGAVALFPGVMDLLEMLSRHGRGSFLVTGASRRSTREVLERLAIARFFRGIITADDVRLGKPHPESFAEALRRNALRADECVAIEDARTGIRSAKAAGLRAVIVCDVGCEQADWSFDTLEDLRVALALRMEGGNS
jgi:HAD superfamily hydrolase (TIGR01509 family)